MSKQKMLIIEDDPAILNGLKDTFDDANFSVTTAHDGHRGFTLAQKSFFDIILLDVTLPRKNGFEICHDLRSRGCSSGIIMLTAHASESDKVEGFGLGADDYLAKPFSVAELKARVKVLTEKKSALKKVTDQNSRLSKEIDKARHVQTRLFPVSMPVRTGWDFAGTCIPANEVGGDYYDIFEISEDTIVIALGDVSGKGLGAAMLMSAVHAMIHSKAPMRAKHLDTLAAELNQYLLSASTAESFITLFLGCIDTTTGTLNYVNCGHPPPILFPGSNGPIQKLKSNGLLLGLLPDCKAVVETCRILPGQYLAAYSDGISEARNKKNIMFGEDGILRTLTNAKDINASHATQTLITSVSLYAGNNTADDDMTVLFVSRY